MGDAGSPKPFKQKGICVPKPQIKNDDVKTSQFIVTSFMRATKGQKLNLLFIDSTSLH
jgi:hypothetical protein